MNIKELITKKIQAKGRLTVSEVVQETGFSRAYVQRTFKSLVSAGEIYLIGRANNAHYVLEPKEVSQKKIIRELVNKDLSESTVWNSLKSENLLKNTSTNTMNIIGYAFTEILNNAIEHSRAKDISIILEQKDCLLSFDINDNGVGILNNIRKKMNLKNNQEAIQDLLKGKQTTAPKEHSGEGLFFTSRVADKMIIYASGKKIIFDNDIDDVFVKDNPERRGTRVHFEIDCQTKKRLESVFRKYTGDSFRFDKTEVLIKLYEMGTEYISRSQARRVLVGLDKFKTIILDFDKVKTVGQGFADEIFRVWQNNNSKIKIDYKNANENVELMIRRALS